MPPASSAIRFGALLRQADNQWSSIVESARICDDLGFHSIYFIDHLLAIPDATGDISGVMDDDDRVRRHHASRPAGRDVLCNSFRSPASSPRWRPPRTQISGGRFELGMGAGWHEPEYRAYGFEFPSPGVRIEQLAEAVRIIKRLWTGERVDFEGHHYPLSGGTAGHAPPVAAATLIIGGAGERKMLRLVAEEADIWNASPAPMPGWTTRSPS